eukprot:SAG31_NODE_483_length_15042_cov_28.867764_2_plen_184_part_00
MTDYSVVCIDSNGSVTTVWATYLGVGAVACVFWSLGVPAFLGLKLYKHRKIIQEGNLHFAGIVSANAHPRVLLQSLVITFFLAFAVHVQAGLRPLFQFYKSGCFMFEIVLMIEKLVLTGVLRVLKVYVGGFLLVSVSGISFNIFMLCVVIAYRPSKTSACDLRMLAVTVASPVVIALLSPLPI